MKNLKITQAVMAGSAALFLPIVAFAAGTGQNLSGTVKTIGTLVNMVIPLILAFAVLVFFWGLASYLMNSGDTDKKKDGINIMIMGIITIFVMVSIWGIIALLQNTFVGGDSNNTAPTIQTIGALQVGTTIG